MTLTDLFDSVKISFIKHILTSKSYYNIINRIKYYTKYPEQALDPPKEPFCKYIIRFFTHELPPLSFDYILPNPTDKSIDNLVLFMRQMHGYGYRQNSSSKRSYEIVHSEKSNKPSSPNYKVSILHKTKIMPL